MTSEASERQGFSTTLTTGRCHRFILVVCLLLAAWSLGCGPNDTSDRRDGLGASGSSAPPPPLIPSPLGEELLAAGFQAEAAEWAWVRPEPGGYRIAGSALEIRSLPGTLWGGNNTLRNIALRTAPGSEFTVEVTVDGEVTNPAEQAGLLLYSGDDDYLKLVREMVGGERVVIFAAEVRGQATVVRSTALGRNDATLRMVVAAGGVTAWTRLEQDSTWQPAGQTTAPAGEVRVGLFSQGGPGARWARLSDFRLSR